MKEMKPGITVENSETPNYPEGRDLLKGKAAVITAAEAQVSVLLQRRDAEEGARVLLSDTHENRLNLCLHFKVNNLKRTVFRDVTKENEVQELLNFAISKFKTVDVMINNAGLGGQSNLIDMSDEEWEKVLDVTLNGTMSDESNVTLYDSPKGSNRK